MKNKAVERQREKAKLKGYKRRDYYATPEEHEELKDCLSNCRVKQWRKAKQKKGDRCE